MATLTTLSRISKGVEKGFKAAGDESAEENRGTEEEVALVSDD